MKISKKTVKIKKKKARSISKSKSELDQGEFRERNFGEILNKTIEHPKPIKGYQSTLPKAFGEEFKYHVPFDQTRGQRIFPAKKRPKD
ncbi:MAG: hypothetical protein H6757_06255 [Candidatus Omnitrophica bacterium]|nr:hypothetical protein [Candidatus Omnitrophota bacterium]